MATVSQKKKRLILDKAKKVFIEKGYAAVTMQDIIDACEISRGGIYIYFSSVEKIYKDVIELHNKEESSTSYVANGLTFNEILDNYLGRHKQRLMKIDDSLLMSMYEFRFAHKDNLEAKFFRSQYESVKSIIKEIIDFGCKNGDINCNDPDALSAHVVFFIEGISMLGTAFQITPLEIDKQLEILKNIILSSS